MDAPADFGENFGEHFHRFDQANDLTEFDSVSDFNKRRIRRRRSPPEDPHQRRFDTREVGIIRHRRYRRGVFRRAHEISRPHFRQVRLRKGVKRQGDQGNNRSGFVGGSTNRDRELPGLVAQFAETRILDQRSESLQLLRANAKICHGRWALGVGR